MKAFLVLCVYLLAGLTLGLADPWFGRMLAQAGLKPGVATALSVNALLPLLAIGLAVFCPRLTTVCLGALDMTAAYVIGLALMYAGPGPWNPADLLAAVRPVLVAAFVGYIVLGCLTVFVTRAVKRAGGYETPTRAA